MKIQEIINKLHSGEIVPRYHKAVGMIQFYLTDDVRMHVFHPATLPEPEVFGNRHSHRFDLHSTVLLGCIIDIEFLVETSHFVGRFREWEVQPAHLGEAPPTLAHDVKLDVKLGQVRVVKPGQSYTVERRVHHQSVAHGVTVTVVRKANQEDKQARILAYAGQKPEHAMAHDKSAQTLKYIVIDALSHLGVWHEQMIDHVLREAENAKKSNEEAVLVPQVDGKNRKEKEN